MSAGAGQDGVGSEDARAAPRAARMAGAPEPRKTDVRRRLLETESLLAASEQRFTTAIHTMLDGFAIQSAIRDETGKIVDFRIDYVNDAACRILGLSRDELIGGCLRTVLPGATEEGTFAAYARVVDDDQPFSRDSLVYTGPPFGLLAGASRAFDIRATRLGDGCAVSFRDVTDRKRAEDELFASRQMLLLVLDTVPQRVFWKDTRCVYVGANRLLAHDAGYADPFELVGKTDYDTSWRESADRYRADDFEVMTSGAPKVNYVEPMVRSDGTTLSLLTSKVPLRDRGGKVIGVLGTYEDITDRIQAEKALRESEERYRNICEAVTDYVFTVRVQGGVAVGTTHGPGCVAVTGYTPEELAGNGSLWIQMVEPGDRELVEEQARRILAGERYVPIEHRIVRKDGVVRWVRNTPVLQYRPDGTLAAYDGLIQDITERRALQEQLLQAQKMEGIGRLAGGVAHDFNNLLTAILGWVEMARTDLPADLPPDHPARLDIEEVAAAGERAATLTRQLLAFASKQVVAPQRLDLSTLVGDSLNMLRRLLGENIQITTMLEPGTCIVEADPGQVQQLLVNLTVNARDAMPTGGRLTIETALEDVDAEYAATHPGVDPGPHVRLSVTDTGIGMSEFVRSHLFEPFFTTKERGKGTGLGLATCHGIVKQFGGHIRVYSEPGQGTTFRIFLPMAEGRPESAQPTELAGPAPSGSETVLVVEDEPSVRRLAVIGLRAQGYLVLEATDGNEALAVAERVGREIDLVISDVVMPGLSGPELVQRLAEVARGARALLMSGHAEGDVPGGVEHDGLPFLPKPFTPERLARKVREVLDAR